MAAAIPGPSPAAQDRATPYGWLIFALILGLMLSDYMSRQVLGAVFPLLKAEWHLSDEQLGRLGAIIPLMVGVLAFPLSFVADRYGRVRAIVAMALLWSAATLLCGVARNYGEMLAARALIGVGEAAYGSVGLAVILGVFPARMRAALTAGFMACGTLGSLVGVALGGTVAADHGWRMPFAVMAGFGLLFTLAFAATAREARLAPPEAKERAPVRSVIGSKALCLIYVGSGVQLFIAGALIAWLPSWFNRVHHLAVDKAGQAAAAIFLVQAVGMVVCGQLSDRIAAERGERRYHIAIAVGLLSASLLGTGFLLPPSPLQLVLIGTGAFFAAGTTGPVGSLVAQLNSPALLATALAVVTLGNNVFGLAPAPWITGQLADSLGIGPALAIAATAGLVAALAFALAARAHASSSARSTAIGS